MTALPALSTPQTAPVASGELDSVRAYAQAARADSTLDTYAKSWRVWTRWCDARGVTPLPASAEAVARFAAHEADRGMRPGTIEARLSAVAAYHRAAGHPNPADSKQVRLVVSGIRRRLDAGDVRRVAPVTVPVLVRVLAACGDGAAGARDRCALLLGVALAARRSELAALELRDVEHVDDGLRVTIRRSKTDQEGAGHTLGVPYGSSPETCPVTAVNEWLAVSATCGTDPNRRLLLRVHRGDRVLPTGVSGHAIAELVKRAVARAGLDPDEFSGHSLRAGLCTSAAAAGVAEVDIARQSRHKSIAVLRQYVREQSLFTRNAAGAVL